ncbi:hypothetical protein JCM14076_03840 [Methylosoma difficile]
MAELPLLIFPQAKVVPPPIARFGISKPHMPSKNRQVSRLTTQFNELERLFLADKAVLVDTIAGMEPEMVLVIETVGHIEDFQRAIANTPGLEWLAEWDDEFEPDDDFYTTNSKKEKTEKYVEGRVFLSMANQRGLNELLNLWKRWKHNQELPFGKGKWKDVFSQIKVIRRWGLQEQFIDTKMLEIWQEDLLYDYSAEEAVNFQIEFFYRKDTALRKQNEAVIKQLLTQLSGQIISPFLDYPSIGFHAVKANLPKKSIQLIVEKIHKQELDIVLLKLPSIMFFRPTGQTAVSSPSESQPIEAAPDSPVAGEPVVAILDGVPFSQHQWLKNRIRLDDVDELETHYQRGDRKHGTAMASLVIHGELDANELPLPRPVYFRPIMQPDPLSRNRDEYVPDEIFYEDRIERAVRRMFDGDGDVLAQAPTIKIINLSFGDPSRQFIHTPSPCAKLLDWLAWKYKVLFCVSTGNFSANFDLHISENDFEKSSDDEKIKMTLQAMSSTINDRKLLSPAESLNAITVGASHQDSSIITTMARRIDILPSPNLLSPISRLGYGFRRSIKPEILLPGGRQFYDPALRSGMPFKLNQSILPPGQRVATERLEAEQSASTYTRGTSNATALATRAAAKIYEVINTIRAEQPESVKDDQVAVLIKALLVHGASRADSDTILEQHLKTANNSRQFKQYASKFIGYGLVNVDRVLACTEQRATVIGCGEIREKQVHEYRFPLPQGLANTKDWRRLTITLAWFTPINPNHRYLRQAKLFFEPPKQTDALNLKSQESDRHQVRRGTVQHEILESEKVSDYQQGDELVIPIQCNADAVDKLDEKIPYGLAVTLEVKEGVNIQIYQEISAHIHAQVKIKQ